MRISQCFCAISYVYVHGCLPSFYVEVEVIAECIKGTVYLNIIITLQVSVVVVVVVMMDDVVV